MLKRVRMVQYYFPEEAPGGAEMQAIALATRMRDRGVEAQVLGVAPLTGERLADVAAPLRPIGWNGAFNAALKGRIDDYSGVRRVAQLARYDGYLLALRRHLRATSQTGDVVVFSYLAPFSGVGSRACRGLCPTVTEWAGELRHHDPSFEMSEIWPMGRRIRSWALDPRGHFVSHFRKGLEELDALGVPKDHQSFLPNGIDTDRFSPAQDRAEIRARLGLSEREFLIAYVARLRPKKEHPCAFAALAKAVERGVPARLLVIGSGDQRERLEDDVRAKGLEEHVTFCGSVADVREYLRAADVAMLLSSTEGPSMAVTEALCCGLPVIATDVGGLPDSVIPMQTGLLVPVGEPGEVAEAVVHLWRNRELLARLSRGARDFMVADRDLEVITDRYLGILEEVSSRWGREHGQR